MVFVLVCEITDFERATRRGRGRRRDRQIVPRDRRCAVCRNRSKAGEHSFERGSNRRLGIPFDDDDALVPLATVDDDDGDAAAAASVAPRRGDSDARYDDLFVRDIDKCVIGEWNCAWLLPHPRHSSITAQR